MKLKGDYILIKSIETPDEEVSKGGIIIPHLQEEPPMMGHVIEVGSGYLGETFKLGENGFVEKVFINIPIDDISVGDKVLFPRWAGDNVEIDGEEYLFLKHDHVMAIVEE